MRESELVSPMGFLEWGATYQRGTSRLEGLRYFITINSTMPPASTATGTQK